MKPAGPGLRAFERSALAVLAGVLISGCALVEPPYGISVPVGPSGPIAVVSPHLKGQLVPGTVLWRLEGGHPALLHQSGQASLLGWGVEPGLDPAPAFISYGPYWQMPVKTPLRVKFTLDAPACNGENQNMRVATLDVREGSVGILATREVTRGDFPLEGGEREFTLDFLNDPTLLKRLEFRVAWWGNEFLAHKSTEVVAGE